MNSRKYLLSLGLVVLIAAACGGSKEVDLFAGPGAASSTSSTSGSTSSTSGSTSSTSSGSSGTTSGGPTDAGKPDTLVAGDDKGRVFCGRERGSDVYCKAGEVCCAERDIAGAKYVRYACAANALACAGPQQMAIVCDDLNDCGPAQECCAIRSQVLGRYVRTLCIAAGTCRGTAAGEERVQMCDVRNASECRVGTTCGNSQFLVDYGVCSP